MSYQSSILANPAYIVPDVSIEQNYRDLFGAISTKLGQCGFVQAPDAGQYNPVGTAYARSNSTYSGAQGNNPNAAFDGNTSNGSGFRSNVAPTTNAPVYVYLDMGAPLGVANTFNPASMRVFSYTNAYDPKTYTLDYADAWTIDPATGAITANWTPVLATGGVTIPALGASNVAFQNLVAPGAHRLYRIGFQDTQGGAAYVAAYVQVPEIEFYSAASGGGTKLASLVSSGPNTSGNTQTGNFQLWKLNDFGALNGFPFFLKTWLGSGSGTGYPAIWVQGGTVTDGGGNFTGASQTSAIQQIRCGANSLSIQQRNMFCGNNVNTSAAASDGRFNMGLFYNLANAPMILNIERSKNADGTDDYTSPNARVDIFCMDSQGTKQLLKVPRFGFVPPPSTDTGMFLDSDGTTSSLRGSSFALAPNFPFLGSMQLPGMGLAAHWLGEATMEQVVTETLYGVTHSYFPLGNNLTGVARGAVPNSRLALRYE